MLLILLCTQLVVRVLSEAPLAPPQDVHVDNWLLTWTPATEERDVTYTVHYRSFNTEEWKDVPACVQISQNSCNVTSTKAKGEHGCVALRVRAERRQLTSRAVEACSRHGDSCTPEVSLTARPGSLTVHLSRDHSLAVEYKDHAKHIIYYGKEGEPLEETDSSFSSWSIHKLQEGQRYCAKVQYTYFRKPVGLPSCAQCELIPDSRGDVKQTELIVSMVVVVIFLLILIPVVVYVLIFHGGRIKQWLQPPYQIPEHFFLEEFPEPLSPAAISPSQEQCDVICCITPEESRQ